MRQERRDLRTAQLIRQDETENQMAAAVERSKNLDTTVKGKYSIWRRDYDNPNSDSTLKLMRDQLIMAKAYANIAKSKNESSLYNSLMKHSRESQHAIGEANSDAELHPRYCNSLSTILDTGFMLGLGFHAHFLTFPISVHLIEQKQWATFSPWQKTSYMTVPWFQGSLDPCFSPLKRM